MKTLRKVNDINAFIESQIDYYENHSDYQNSYLDFLGDNLQYDGIYNDEQINLLLDSDLTTSTDYGYLADNCIALWPVGEIEIDVETNLTEKEYKAIKDKIDYAFSFKDGVITCFICTGMNVRAYSDLELTPLGVNAQYA